MKANQEFLKDPYQSGKNVLGPKLAIQLQCNQDLLDTFITKTLYEPSHNTLLPSLARLPLPPILSLASHSKYKKKCMLAWYYCNFVPDLERVPLN